MERLSFHSLCTSSCRFFCQISFITELPWCRIFPDGSSTDSYLMASRFYGSLGGSSPWANKRICFSSYRVLRETETCQPVLTTAMRPEIRTRVQTPACNKLCSGSAATTDFFLNAGFFIPMQVLDLRFV